MKKLIPALLLLLSSACGTETGNPYAPPPPASNTSVVNGAQILVDAICAKLTACFTGLSAENCQSGVKASSSVDTELGLPSGFGTFQAIINAENAGTIQASGPARTACVSAIGALSCADTQVTSAYQPASPSDFSNLGNLLPADSGSCPAVY